LVQLAEIAQAQAAAEAKVAKPAKVVTADVPATYVPAELGSNLVNGALLAGDVATTVVAAALPIAGVQGLAECYTSVNRQAGKHPLAHFIPAAATLAKASIVRNISAQTGRKTLTEESAKTQGSDKNGNSVKSVLKTSAVFAAFDAVLAGGLDNVAKLQAAGIVPKNPNYRITNVTLAGLPARYVIGIGGMVAMAGVSPAACRHLESQGISPYVARVVGGGVVGASSAILLCPFNQGYKAYLVNAVNNNAARKEVTLDPMHQVMRQKLMPKLAEEGVIKVARGFVKKEVSRKVLVYSAARVAGIFASLELVNEALGNKPVSGLFKEEEPTEAPTPKPGKGA
jgi:hypothetical protein